MRRVALLCFPAFFFLGACSGEISPEPEAAGVNQPLVGSDRDAHGCITSAGYRWCAAEKKCVRPWELAKEKDLDPTPEAFDEYCRNEAD